MRRSRLVAVILTTLLGLTGLIVYQLSSPARDPRPPVGKTPTLPFGAVFSEGALPIEEWRRTQLAHLAEEIPKKPKEILILSCGGARGAFGAGLLQGWTETGERPMFDVVTGVSVGSLQAVFAFLGPNYDDELLGIFSVKQSLARVSWWSRSQGALMYGGPLREAIDENFDEAILAAVAKRHQEGARLYVGTSNLDTQEFVIWDMGLIASSGRPEALEHFRSVLQASCSMPAVFPPVLFELEQNDQEFDEMHVDGGVRAPTFLPRFVIKAASGQSAVNVYLIINNTLTLTPHVSPVSHTVKDIGFSSFKMLLQDKLILSVESLREQCYREKFGLKILDLPPDWGGADFSVLPENAVQDPAALFERSRNLIKERPWSKLPEETPY